MAAIELIQEGPRAAALLHPLRRRILAALREPDSASGVARRLDLPRQKINYHLRDLEKQGLLELVEERRKGNCVERLVRATASAYVISPEAVGALGADPRDLQDRFSSSYLVAVAARAIHDIGILRQRAAAAGKRLGTFTLEGEVRIASPARRKQFMEALTRAIGTLTAEYHDDRSPQGRRFRFILAGYPSAAEGEGGAGRVEKEGGP